MLSNNELTYIVVVGDSSKMKLEECYETHSELTDLQLLGYLALKLTSQELWKAWIYQPGFTRTKVTGGMLSYPQFRGD